MKYKEIWKVYNKVFDLQTLRNLEFLRKKGIIGEDLYTISEGKEAIVFKSTGEWGDAAVKIYKVMEVSYKQQYAYLLMDPRFRKFPRTRIGIIYTWVKKEYSNLTRMYKNLVSVPMPIAFKGNILVMEWIGDINPAPQLHDIIAELSPNIFEKILNEYKRILNKAKLVHGDFSEYNILLYKNALYIIDVSQAIPIDSEAAQNLLERDIKNIYLIAKKLKVNISIEDIKEKLKWSV